jgi:hypothetical protein
VEIAPKPPTGFEKVPGPTAYSGSLYVSAGTVRFSDGQGAEVAVDAGKCVSLVPDDRKAAVTAAKAAAAANPRQPVSPPELKTLPKWADGTGSRTLTPSVRRTRALFEKEFDLDPPISESLSPVVRKSDPLLSEAAVKCLALIQDHAALVEALARGTEHESRVQAVRGLQLWLGESVENSKPLRTDLATVYTGPDIDAVVQLLWGYDESDARNPVTSKKLVAWLDHGEIGIRELAFWHVKRLTGRDYDYLPHRPALQRQAAVVHWLSHVEKTGALLPPTPVP